MQNNFTLHPILGQVLHKRGLTQKAQLEEFFSWDLKSIPSFSKLKDVSIAAKRIAKAVLNDEKIAAFGDYDADGTTSLALLWHFFKLLNIEIDLLQPSRFVEGYGLHISSVDKAQELGAKLLISVDCGITAHETANYAREKNLDLIITDHHLDSGTGLPEAFAVVNPNRQDEDANSPFAALAGVGVAFFLCTQVRTELILQGIDVPSLYPLLQFVAIGTICDLAPLNSLNLKLCRHGLHAMPKTTFWGIRAFLAPEEREEASVPGDKIGFYIGPMINSKGRLEHPEEALRLLTAQDEETAREYHTRLEIANNERKFVQNQIYGEAKEDILNSIEGGKLDIAIAYAPHWHEGVIGIVASKLVDNFKVPALVFTQSQEEGILKSSARSVGELNLYELLHNCQEYFLKFGGHEKAAGLSLKEENFASFKQKIQAEIQKIPLQLRMPNSYYDLELSPEQINVELAQQLSIMGPFGPHNEKPVFHLKDFQIESFKLMKDIHVRWFFSSKKNPQIKLQAVSFNFVGKWGVPHPQEIFRMQDEVNLKAEFFLDINKFNGKSFLQLQVQKFIY